ncbi:Clp protease N-terminal domain-containing protein [Pseudonocardia sp. KRD291]|uniref:Clp protease N-terminal domain-containing protein n=1 Tax=Pseudonocardia sp. KRD291 TaxID=2792007 RepID=UPI001C4A31F5|nr:Clp protease N-terminal domain-containing protein [Pseudonocardia sp. KRD291]MBW0106497.1 Clp protease [Pseudonocardia sp. KRD291]
MFERFTDPARRVVVMAQQDARERHQDRVRTENLLLGVVTSPGTPGEALLRAAGLDRDVVEADLARRSAPHDAEALASLGIDLDEVRRRVDESFGPGALERTRAARGRRRPGHIPFDRSAKKALELALREAIRLGHRHIGTEHLLLGLLWPGSTAQEILAGRDLTLDGMRIAVADLGRGSASG